jgi:hypothetical protein
LELLCSAKHEINEPVKTAIGQSKQFSSKEKCGVLKINQVVRATLFTSSCVMVMFGDVYIRATCFKINVD